MVHSFSFKIFIGICFFWQICTPLSGQTINTEMLFEVCKNATVKIETSKGYSGTGFFVAANGYLLTNHHVINDCEYDPAKIKIKLYDGTLLNCKRVIAFKHFQAEDIALLQADISTPHPILPFIETPDANNAIEVAAIGNPMGSEFSINKGIISNLEVKGAYHLLQTDVLVNPGNSGGPLLNKNGQVVGMIVSKLHDAYVEGINFAIKASVLKNFLEVQKISYQTQPLIENTSLKKNTELTEEEKNYIKQKNKQIIDEKTQLEIQKIQNAKILEEERLRRQQTEAERQEELRRIELERAKEEQQLRKKEARYQMPTRLSLRIGGGIQSLQTLIVNDVTQTNAQKQPYTNDAPLFQAMFAYRTGFSRYANRRSRGNAIGVFGTYGWLAKEDLSIMQFKTTPPQDLNLTQPFWEVELGILLREWIRIGGGIGEQSINSIRSPARSITYYTATLGIVFKWQWVSLDLHTTALLSEELLNPALRTNLTLNLYLNWGKW